MSQKERENLLAYNLACICDEDKENLDPLAALKLA